MSFLEKISPTFDMPASRRKYLWPLVTACWCLVSLFIYLSLEESANRKLDDIDALKANIRRAAPIVAETKILQASRSELSTMSALAAVREVSRQLQLDAKLSAIRPNELGEGREGVQTVYIGLYFDEALELMKALEMRGGLQAVSGSINRSPAGSGLVDMQLILSR